MGWDTIRRRWSAAAIALPLLTATLLGAGCANQPPPDLDSPACQTNADFGVEVGDYVQNFALKDQNGDEVFLSDYCGEVVVMQMGAMWCPSCRNEAQKIPELMSQYDGEGVVILSLMTEAVDGNAPSTRDLGSWAVTFDLETPVLADKNWRIWDRYFPVHATPRAILMDRDGKLAVVDWVVTEAQIDEEL